MAAFEDRTSPDLDQFKGGKWTDWLSAIQSSEPKQQGVPEHLSKRNVEVARLRRPDMGLFGYRPATDKFYLVVCEHCGHLVKPQSLNIHYERKHKNKRITRLPSSSHSRLSHVQSKHTIDKSNHRILPPPHISKQHGTSSSHQKTSHLSSERVGSDVTKSEHIPEKLAIAAALERRHGDSSNSRNQRTQKSGTKLIAPQPAKVPNAAIHDNLPNQVRSHQSSKHKPVHKLGGTIQLNEIPESHIKSSSRHSVESKHQQRHHRTSGSSSKPTDADLSHSRGDHKKIDKSMTDTTQVSGSKSRKNHDGYHHHYHQTPSRDSRPDNNALSPDCVKLLSPGGDCRVPVPLVVLEKTQVSGGGKAGQAHKRSRPVSGSSESSVSPPRHKIPALHSMSGDKGPTTTLKAPEIVPNSVVPAKVKKKEKKILPLKDREYDPNKHCGVWVKDENSHCRRSLTCKVHPLNAKRAVTGRCKEFDELIQDRGREKQRLKERAAAAAHAIKSPPAPSPVEFAVPSPAPKATPLSPPVCTTVTPLASQSSMASAPKIKSSISLFPRNFNAWHVDCWDNDEVPEDSMTAKLQNSCTCIQRHPQPFMVLEFQSRKSGTCQVSYSRRGERQLEALSSNFQKFGNKPPKMPKPFSFSPISGTTYRSSHAGVPNLNTAMHVFNQVPQRTAANSLFVFNQPQRGIENVQHVSGTQNAPRISQITSLNNGIQTGKFVKAARNNSLNRRLSNLAPPDGSESQVKQSKADAMVRNRSRSEQVLNMLKRTPSNSSGDVGFITQANDLNSTSPLLILNNSKEIASSPMQVPIVADVSNANSSLVSLRTAIPSSEDRKRSTTPSAKLKLKSAMPNYSTMTQPHTQAANAEHVDGTPILVQIPNGLNQISGNVLLKPGSHSVTLSGNIGALTVTGDDPNFTGNKLSAKLKNLNSNNNFIVQGDGIPSTPLLTESKQVIQPQLSQSTVSHTHQPLGGAAAENFLLQSDDHFLVNQQTSENVPVLNTVNLNQQYAMQNSNFSHSVTLDQQTQGQSNSSATTDILRVLCSPTENCDALQAKLDKHNPHHIGNINQIDPAILEQVFGSQAATIPHGRLSVDATQGCSTSNATRTSDLGQNFISR